MTIQEILENKNIKSDQYGMAAIAYVYKAFGDNIKYKELWPWVETISDTDGFDHDLTIAIQLLNKAKVRHNDEDEKISIKYDNSVSIQNLKKRLSQINMNLKSANKNSTNINNASKEVEIKSNIIIQ